MVRPADILVVLGQRGGGFGVGGIDESVLVRCEEVFDLFEAHEAGLIGESAGGIETVGVAFAEAEQS